jgi:hypothetical protein
MLKAAKKMKKDKKKANATLSQALSAALLTALVAHAPAAHSSEVARSPYFGFSVFTLFLFLCIRFFKVARLFITTRNYFNGKLENRLFQFTYNLENFNKHDQADYLNDYWISNL